MAEEKEDQQDPLYFLVDPGEDVIKEEDVISENVKELVLLQSTMSTISCEITEKSPAVVTHSENPLNEDNVQYKRIQKTPPRNYFWKSRTLLMKCINFLTHCENDKSGGIVLYAGPNSGEHVPQLAELFPNKWFFLFGKRRFHHSLGVYKATASYSRAPLRIRVFETTLTEEICEIVRSHDTTLNDLIVKLFLVEQREKHTASGSHFPLHATVLSPCNLALHIKSGLQSISQFNRYLIYDVNPQIPAGQDAQAYPNLVQLNMDNQLKLAKALKPSKCLLQLRLGDTNTGSPLHYKYIKGLCMYDLYGPDNNNDKSLLVENVQDLETPMWINVIRMKAVDLAYTYHFRSQEVLMDDTGNKTFAAYSTAFERTDNLPITGSQAQEVLTWTKYVQTRVSAPIIKVVNTEERVIDCIMGCNILCSFYNDKKRWPHVYVGSAAHQRKMGGGPGVPAALLDQPKEAGPTTLLFPNYPRHTP
jgi:hypothetical protein